jgi:hypothetical protein
VSIRVPPKRIREQFLIIYELEGCRKAADFLTEYYSVGRMAIILNGRKVGNGFIAQYFENKATFTKMGLKKRVVLHELYHHLVKEKGVELADRLEERQAISYASQFLRG